MRPSFRPFSTALPLAALAAALLFAPQGASAVSLSIGFEGGTQTVFTDADLDCLSAGSLGELQCSGGALLDWVGGWEVDALNLFVDPDPTVSNSISVTNNTLSTQTFLISIVLPVSLTFGPPSFIKGSVSGSATDNNGNGVTLGTSGGISLYQALIDGSVVRTLHDDPFSVSAGGFDTASIPVANFGIPIAESENVATLSDIGITLRFTLTPGDSAAITSVFNVEPIPEPGTAILLFAGLAGLARMGRPRA